MKRLIVHIVLVFSMSLSSSCSAQQEVSTSGSVSDEGTQGANSISGNADQQGTVSNILASKDGHQLTEEDLRKANEIEAVLDGESYTREVLIAEFEEDPAGTLATINEIYAEVVDIEENTSGSSSIVTAQQSQQSASFAAASQPQSEGALANGHRQLRQILFTLMQQSGSGQQLSEQAFNTPSVNSLRSFLKNSQIVSSGTSAHSSSTHTYVLCADGTFYYSYSGSMSLDSTVAGEWNVGGTLTDSARGYWDVYTENGNDAALLYSSDPGFADTSMNGLMPIPIAAYQADLIQMGARGMPATPDMLLRRVAISGCQ